MNNEDLTAQIQYVFGPMPNEMFPSHPLSYYQRRMTMQQIRDAVAFAAADTQNPAPENSPIGLDATTAEQTVGDIVSKAAEELDKHIPETSPFKPFVFSALQMAAAFAIKAIFRHR